MSMTLRAALLTVLMAWGWGADAAAASDPVQIRLCMIGDSITWYGEGDGWRQQLVARLPRLAFVGTHSAKHGYSHAGEGGNGTGQVLKRLPAVPDSPCYHLLIGTNDNNVREEALVAPRAAETAGRIAAIVEGLLARPTTRTVFLGSLLPCTADDPKEVFNPLRARTNAATNVILRGWLGGRLPAERVVWVDYESAVLASPGWERTIRLHPTAAGYELLADRLAETIATALAVGERSALPRPAPGAGVAVDNLLDADGTATREPVIAGWYTLSWQADAIAAGAAVVVEGSGKAFPLRFPVEAAQAGQRRHQELFTGYEGYGYDRSMLRVRGEGCTLTRVQLEKRRPSGLPSVYGPGIHLDAATVPAPGEVLELPPRP
jgi:lysophospholipase L1-like esterase